MVQLPQEGGRPQAGGGRRQRGVCPGNGTPGLPARGFHQRLVPTGTQLPQALQERRGPRSNHRNGPLQAPRRGAPGILRQRTSGSDRLRPHHDAPTGGQDRRNQTRRVLTVARTARTGLTSAAPTAEKFSVIRADAKANLSRAQEAVGFLPDFQALECKQVQMPAARTKGPATCWPSKPWGPNSPRQTKGAVNAAPHFITKFVRDRTITQLTAPRGAKPPRSRTS